MKVLLFIILTLVLIGIATCIGIASAGLQTLEEGQLMSHCASSYLSFARKSLSNFHFIYFGPFFEACVFPWYLFENFVLLHKVLFSHPQSLVSNWSKTINHYPALT